LLFLVVLTGCPILRATGKSVEAIGEGTGHAIEKTGEAITDEAR